jgi:hypothetical protein
MKFNAREPGKLNLAFSEEFVMPDRIEAKASPDP